jgi:small-conductance mechanosensitive channel
MADKDMQNELEQLRAEVAALSAARAGKKAAEAQADTSPVESQSPETGDLTGDIGGILENVKAAAADDAELSGQFDQLIEQLEHEIKDLPAITTLAVFSLGVLFGRLLR